MTLYPPARFCSRGARDQGTKTCAGSSGIVGPPIAMAARTVVLKVGAEADATLARSVHREPIGSNGTAYERQA
jgi:hypothetical protein